VNDPQILPLELAHGMLVDTATYIDCLLPPLARHPGAR
jgi:hypothetical protein